MTGGSGFGFLWGQGFFLNLCHCILTFPGEGAGVHLHRVRWELGAFDGG